jgi:polysaccharide deacetylase 2 family uncharacterized protein YibQ
LIPENCRKLRSRVFGRAIFFGPAVLAAIAIAGCSTSPPPRKPEAKSIVEREPRRAPASPAHKGTRLAIIIDDMGNDREADDALIALPFSLTISVLPHKPLSAEIANQAARHDDEVMLHLPIQADSVASPAEAIELRVGMPSEEVRSVLAGMLETVPHVTGVNNHEGSAGTADPALMDELMPALRDRNLFFIDSRTTASTVAADAARKYGVRTASRKVFLDDSLDAAAIRGQIELAEHDAEHDGDAIAIGHPHPETIAVLREELPHVKAAGIRLVFASELVR